MASELQITDLELDIKSSHILHNVTFAAVARNLLAIMGPSGSGKTTLMNAIAGRQSISSGAVTLDGQPFTKSLRRRLGLVLQEDVFFPTLTLWETLYFTAMIRMPDNMPKHEKIERLNGIMKELEIDSCRNTVFGDMFLRGLSGGEKKRASIACELLTDPDILLLDEPTSGLDSSTALSLVRLLKQLSVQHNKIVITCIHQPSSQMYYMFDSLLLLAQGQVAYFGGARDDPLDHFLQLGYTCQPHHNPADFFIELVKEDNQTELDKILLLAKKQNQTEYVVLMTKQKPTCEKLNGHCFGSQEGYTNPSFDHTSTNETCYKENGKTSIVLPNHARSTSYTIFNGDLQDDNSGVQRWPTGFMTQFRMLTWRNFKLSRSVILHIHEVLFILFVTGIITTVFYKIPNNADVFRDRMGMVFFIVTFWMFGTAIQSTVTVAAERNVIARERSAGSYRLSAYFLAKNVSEITLRLTLTIMMYTISYWVVGLNDVAVFFKSIPILLMTTMFAQGAGYIWGAGIHDFKLSLIAVDAMMMVFLLASGFITQEFPPWLQWLKYCSVLHHGVSAMTIMTFSGAADVPCNSTSVVQFTKCALNSSDYVTADDVLLEAGIDLPIYCYISTVAIACVLVRVVAYVTLRFKSSVLRH